MCALVAPYGIRDTALKYVQPCGEGFIAARSFQILKDKSEELFGILLLFGRERCLETGAKICDIHRPNATG
jgi:hypothetical protein